MLATQIKPRGGEAGGKKPGPGASREAAAVEIESWAEADCAFGVTVLGVKVHLARPGRPVQASAMAFPNGPSCGLTVT